MDMPLTKWAKTKISVTNSRITFTQWQVLGSSYSTRRKIMAAPQFGVPEFIILAVVGFVVAGGLIATVLLLLVQIGRAHV